MVLDYLKKLNPYSSASLAKRNYQFIDGTSDGRKEFIHQFGFKTIFIWNKGIHLFALPGKPSGFCVCGSAARKYQDTCIASGHSIDVVLELPLS